MGKRGRPTEAALEDSEVNMIVKVCRVIEKVIKKRAPKMRRNFHDKMPCPMCEMRGRRTKKQGRGTLFFNVAGNGHIAAKCTVDKCVSFME